MSTAVNHEIDQLFCDAERRQRLVCVSSNRLGAALARRLKAGYVIRPARSLYARVTYWEALTPIEQAWHLIRSIHDAQPHWVFCGETAALIHGMPVSYSRALPIHVADGPHARPRTSGVIAHHALPCDNPVLVNGIPVTSLARTLCDCLQALPFGDALAYADAALRVSKRSIEELRTSIEALPLRPRGVRRAAGILGYADARSESWAESVVRATILSQGFALPELQVTLASPVDPTQTYRVDGIFTRIDGTCVVLEVDGVEKYVNEHMLHGKSTVRALADEQHREAELTLLGMPVLRISSNEAHDPNRMVAKLTAYDIPRDPETAHAIRRLARRDPISTATFRTLRLTDNPLCVATLRCGAENPPRIPAPLLALVEEMAA